MKKLTTTLRLICFAALLQAQTYTATISPNGQLSISDNAPAEPLGSFDSIAVEWSAFTFGCELWSSGKLPQGQSFDFTLPTSFADGLALRKTIWRGRQLLGAWHWQSQSGECLALVMPAPVVAITHDTTYLTPLTVHVPSSTYSPDWLLPVVSNNSVSFAPTALQPDNIKIDQVYIVSQAGYLMTNYDDLTAGIYFAICVIEWQGMTFVETDEFSIF